MVSDVTVSCCFLVRLESHAGLRCVIVILSAETFRLIGMIHADGPREVESES